MKLLGLIGGVSPESTAIYYRLLNDATRARLGAEHSANLMIYALDYGVMIEHYDNEDWPAFTHEVVVGARCLAAAGVDAIVICSNTTHLAADAVRKATNLPVIHMLDSLAAAMDDAGVQRPLLLGTPVVMSGHHYRPALASRFAGEVVTPTSDEQETVARIILEELVRGDVLDASRRALLDIVKRHVSAGADGVILGCTELCMILSQDHFSLPLFDTTSIHAGAAAAFAREA